MNEDVANVYKTLVHAHQRYPKYYKDILDSIKGIAFIGVPHRGAGIALLGEFFAKLLQASTLGRTTNTELVKLLKKDSKPLADLTKEANHRLEGLVVFSFYETSRLYGHVVNNQLSNSRLNLSGLPELDCRRKFRASQLTE